MATTIARAGDEDPTKIVVEREAGKPITVYSLQDLENDFTYRDLTTVTPWTSGVARTYRGFSLTEILAKNGMANAKIIKGIAPNDFSARIDMDEIKRYNPIVASEVQCTKSEAKTGKCEEGSFRALESEDYGPFYIVWPFDKMPRAYDPQDHSKWIWFLAVLQQEQ
ncbi:hypothetical protein [Phyllobacterium sp. P30BS-XVII]|uniref:hypothetical protein n=1 Tax=Phyllobacterium sp. P30BS-XVII TaxID=2587046 RepID=UPI0015FD7476|nr:hypothetical protein [Phyllobacterium sp. P30BS-XVII]MBA8904166.1 hypothetical protein [Phyllobacterium sp. P30BS-XVII]